MNLNDFLSGPSRMRMPIYQRQYSWEVRQLEDLWNDLVYLEPGKRYYFGTVLLKRTGEEERAGLRQCEVFEIIDGQQRIASVLILLKTVLDELRKTPAWSSQPSEILNMESTYLKYGTLYKLELLGRDDPIFRGIVDGTSEPSPATASQRRLLTARSFFKEKLLEQKKVLSEEEYAKFLDDLMKKALRLEIVKHVVDSDEEAVLIFETVNDRGITLSSLDKTKSFLMHYLYLSGGVTDGPENLRKINDVFATIFSDLEKVDVSKVRGQIKSPKDFEADIQRAHYIIFKSGSTYFYDAFSSLKDQLIALYRDRNTRESGTCSWYALEYATSLGLAFSAIKDLLVYNDADLIKDSLDRVFGLNYTVILPLLISGWMKLRDKPNDLVSLMRTLECLEFRYSSFRSRRSHTLTERMNSMAHDLYHDKQDLKSVLSSLQYLIRRYGSDGAFRADLESENFYYGSKAAMKLLFYEYEISLQTKEGQHMDIPMFTWMSDNYQIDHIWAQAALSDGFEYQQYLRCGNKLGNLAVLPRQLNISLANASFSHKRVPYKESHLQILKDIARSQYWTEKEISERTTNVTNFALKRWEIPKQF